jgi:hypothetical protein
MGLRHQVDTGVVAVQPLAGGPFAIGPDLRIEILVGGLVAQVANDQLFEVGALLAFTGSGLAVGIEQIGKGGHVLRVIEKWPTIKNY